MINSYQVLPFRMLLSDNVPCALNTLLQHRDLPLNLCAGKELKEGETKTRVTYLKAAVQDKDDQRFDCCNGSGDEKRKWTRDSLDLEHWLQRN